MASTPETRSIRKRARRRVTLACARCHRKKIRCDGLKPSCSNCKQTDSACLGILDGETKTVVPRSIVQYLQDAIAHKELDLQRRNIDVNTPYPADVDDLQRDGSQSTSRRPLVPSHSKLTTWLIENFGAGLNTRFLNTGGGFPIDLFLFSPSHLPAVGPSAIVKEDTGANVDDQELTELSQIPHKIAELLARNYIQKILPLYPLIDEDELWASFRKACPSNGVTTYPEPHDIFVTSMVLGVSIMTSKFSDSNRIESSSDKICRNALRYVQHLCAPTLRNIQAIHLLAQYSYLMPRSASIWETVNLSMRMALELGLHRDPDETPYENAISAKEANLRRCIFWCIYEMDRSICGTSHRSLSLAENMITTKYPSGMESTCFLCVVKFRRIQSEIMTVNYLCSDAPLIATAQPYQVWLEQTERKILDWRDSIASQELSGPEWYDIAAQHGIVFLNRPSPRNPSPCPESLIKCFIAGTEVVAGYWEHAHSGFLKYSWHAIHQGFESAIVMLYALRKCKSALRERYGIRKILEAVHMYSSLFVLLSERWQKATSCYATYERLKTSVLNEVMRPDDPPHEDNGDELDHLVLPLEGLAKINQASADGFPSEEICHSENTDSRLFQNLDLSLPHHDMTLGQSTAMTSNSAPLDFQLTPDLLPNERGLDSSLLGVGDNFQEADWAAFGLDAFNEQSFMLWTM